MYWHACGLLMLVEDVHAIFLYLLIGETRDEHGLFVKLIDVALQNSFLLSERLRGRELIELWIHRFDRFAIGWTCSCSPNRSTPGSLVSAAVPIGSPRLCWTLDR